MPLKTEKRTIGELEVTTTQLPALRALELMTKLGKVLAPIVGAMPGMTAKNMDVSKLGPVLGVVFGQLNEGEATKLARAILASTRVTMDNKFIELTSDNALNSVFEGRLQEMLLTMGFVLEVNYASFFPRRSVDATPAPQEGNE